MTTLSADEKIGVAGASLIAALVMMQFIFPAWHWLWVDKLNVLTARENEPVPVEYDRKINMDFTGDWRVKVWRVESDGLLPVCASPDKAESYRTTAKLPAKVTLEWLAYTDPNCYKLEPGDYEIEVVWNINPGSFWERTVKRRDTFRILE